MSGHPTSLAYIVSVSRYDVIRAYAVQDSWGWALMRRDGVGSRAKWLKAGRLAFGTARADLLNAVLAAAWGGVAS